MKKDRKQSLLHTPGTVMVNGKKRLSRIQRPYKMAKFDKQLFCPNQFFLHDTSSCMHMLSLSIVYTKYHLSKSSGTSWLTKSKNYNTGSGSHVTDGVS